MSKLSLLLLVTLFSCQHLFAQTLVISGQNRMPFSGRSGSSVPGYMVEVTRAIFESKGYKVEYRSMPWRRALHQVDNGIADAVLGANRAEARGMLLPEESFGFVEDVFYVKKGEPWRFVGLNSLSGMRLGVVGGVEYGPEIADYIRKNEGTKYVQILYGEDVPARNLDKLLYGRTDIVVLPSQVERWVRKTKEIPLGEIVSRGTIGQEKDIFIAFAQGKKDSEQLAKLFSDGIRELRQSGKLKIILDRYGLQDWKPQLKKGSSMEFVYAESAEPVTLDPAEAYDLQSGTVINLIFDGLVRYRDDSTEVEPDLAKSWEIRNKGTEWIFQLRQGIRFHDGTALDADAVVFSFRRQFDKAFPEYTPDLVYADFTFKNVKSVVALDKYRVKITLDNPYAPFLANMAMAAAKIISPSAYKTEGVSFNKHPVGTGPFVFERWQPGKEIVLRSNLEYWRGKSYIDKLTYKVVPGNQLMKEFLSGKLDVVGGLQPEEALVVENNATTSLQMGNVMHVKYLAMNMELEPFNKLKVRQAINHAIDKKLIINDVTQGFAIPAVNPMPPSMWGYNHEIQDYAYDPARARELLKEAGYPDGFETSIAYRGRLDNERLGAIIKRNLDQVGIRVELKSMTREAYFPWVDQGKHQMAFGRWFGDNGDPDNFLYVLLDYDNAVKGKASNYAFYRSEPLHELLLAAQSSQKRQQRITLYRQAQSIINQDAPWVPLYHKQYIIAKSEQVHGVIPHPTGLVRFYRAWVE
ncbi:ABC transporter substrate-binding protein [Dongshaea marina]|uniref:ABC transporter substrate-binding protein n=1 Tax=Dongshaea marina TaxID=2047966 RepID=UPI000D3EB0BA|nr:ABC transporter substrate-binding protein [Dongshaea marina]